MTPCITKTRLNHHPEFPIDIAFSADDISADGGALLVRQAEARLGLCESIAELVPDERNAARVVHSREEQVLQRVMQIALGYADQNDVCWLKDDPMMKAACDREVADAQGLSAQPTLSRFENAPDVLAVSAMQWQLLFSWVRGLDEDCTEIVVDLDSSAFEGYGDQQQLAFCGFHRCHMLHPLLIFDGETGQLITALLRPGNAHDAAGAADWIERLIMCIKTLHRPDCAVMVRADAGFGNPGIYACLEALDQAYGDVYYLIGIARNSVLQAELEPTLKRARARRQRSKKPARIFTDFSYQAGSWKRERQIIGKAEVTMRGDNPRFVVTNLLGFSPRALYEVGYCGRGRCEQYIKEFKNAVYGDRISCTRFVANGFRLILHAVAYRLMFEIRRTIAEELPPPNQDANDALAAQIRWLARASFETIRLRLLKVAFVVRRSARRLYLQGAQSFPMAQLFHHVARAMA